ncbi:MAG: hypothetical protein Athens101410_597 [Parcubacteria group bacterium Athens1014_10]|nr:MAG: hypothetical protein Athens101410_597 [Parcubacteria group bacterium Athens1014_10]TSD06120.1 MAG: hypothetical protein Athens071412_94 [Parcubacteria group bacterium Athens0714_12]
MFYKFNNNLFTPRYRSRPVALDYVFLVFFGLFPCLSARFCGEGFAPKEGGGEGV